MLKELGRFDEAEDHFKEGLEANPENALLYHAYGGMLKELRRFDEAEVQFKKGLKVDSKHTALNHAYASMLKELGRFDEARPLWEKLIEKNRSNLKYCIDYVCFLFYCLDAVNEADQLVKKLSTSANIKNLRKNDRNVINLTTRLITWRKLVLSGSIEALSNVSSHYQYAARLIDHRNFSRGIEELHKIVLYQPEPARAHWRLGRTLTSQGDKEGGLEHLLQAVRLDENEQEFLTSLISALINYGQLSSALDYLDQLHRKFPSNFDFFVMRAFAFTKAGQWDEAEKSYKTALDISENSEDRSRTLKNFAQMLMDHPEPVRLQQAWQVLERAWALCPHDPAIFSTRRRLAERLGRSVRIDEPYRLIRERLETGDPITVRVCQPPKKDIVLVSYYGVHGWLPWVEKCERLRVCAEIDNVLTQGIDDKGYLILKWPSLART